MVLELVDRDMMVIHFSWFCKRKVVFDAIFWTAAIRNHVLDSFSLEIPLIAPVIARAALY